MSKAYQVTLSDKQRDFLSRNPHLTAWRNIDTTAVLVIDELLDKYGNPFVYVLTEDCKVQSLGQYNRENKQ
jgi:hypothetical protein